MTTLDTMAARHDAGYHRDSVSLTCPSCTAARCQDQPAWLKATDYNRPCFLAEGHDGQHDNGWRRW